MRLTPWLSMFSKSLSSRVQHIRHGKRRRALVNQIETLEDRLLLSATYYVDDSWVAVVPGADPDGAGPATNFGVDSFATIQGGVGAANPLGGDTVVVGPGTYTLTAPIVINKPVVVQGAQAGVDARTRIAVPESIVDAGNLTSFPVSAFYVQSGVTGAVIDGFTIQNAQGTGSTGVGAVSLAAGSNGTTIQNNIIQNNRNAVFLANNSLSNQTVIQRNLFANNNSGGLPDIYADTYSSGGGVQNVLITANRFTNTTHVKAAWGIGIEAAASNTNLTVSNNTFDNHGRAMYFAGVTNSSITGNDFTLSGLASQDRYAIGFFGGNNGISITNNRISNSTDSGIEIDGPTDNNITISSNSIVNVAHPIYLDPSAYVGSVLNASNNYWGISNPATIQSSFSNNDVDTTIDFSPILDNNESLANQSVVGFQADLSSFTVHSLGSQVAGGRIKEAIDLQNNDSPPIYAGTVIVTTGTYTETISGQVGTLTLATGAIANLSGVVNGVMDGGTGTLNALGTGTVGTLVIGDATNNGGGGTPDGLKFTGAGFLALDITNTATHDLLDVNGTVALGAAATLTLNVSAFIPADGDEIILIDNDGTADPVTGTFAGLPDGTVISTNFGGSSKTARISYTAGDGNDVGIRIDNPNVTVPTPPPGDANPATPDTYSVVIVGDTVQTIYNGVVIDTRPLDGAQNLTINGHVGGADTLTIDLTANPALADLVKITFNGGGDANDKVIVNGKSGGSDVIVSYTGTDSGSVNVDSTLLVDFDGIGNNTLVINGSNDLTLDFAGGDANIDFTAINATTTQVSGNSFVTTSFTNPSDSLTIRFTDANAYDVDVLDLADNFNPTAGFSIIDQVGGANDVTITDLGDSFTGALAFNLAGGVDSVTFDTNNQTPSSVNIAAETITATTAALSVSGATVLDAGASGTITLTNSANAFNTVAITAAGTAAIREDGNYVIAGATATTSITLESTGTVTETAAINTGTLTLQGTGGTFTLNSQNNDVNTLDANNSALTTLAFRDDDGFDVAGVNVSGALTLNASTTGAITQSALISAGVTDITGGAITLNAANVLGAVTVNAGTGNVSLTENDAISIATIAHTGTLSLNAGTNSITQTGNIDVGTGATNLTGGVITLNLFNNIFGDITVNSGAGNVNLRDGSTMNIAGITRTSGSVTLQAGGGLGLTQSGPILIGTGALILNAGPITLNAANVLGPVSTSVSQIGDISITENDDITIAGLSQQGGLTLNAGSNSITQTGVIQVSPGAANFTGGTITLTLANVLGAVTVNAGTGDVSLTENDGIAITSIAHTGTLTLNAGANAITQTGVVNVGTGTTNLTGSNITLGSANVLGAVTVNAGTGTVSLTEADAIAVASITHTGNLSLNAGSNAITQSGVINVGTGTANLTGSTITLGSANVLGAITVNAGTGDVSLTEADAISIAALTHAGNLVLNAGTNDITQSGVINVGTGTANFTGSNITLGSANVLGDITVNAGTGAVAITESGAITVAAITHTGTVGLTAGTTISQSGAISGTTLTTSSAGGTTLGSANTVTGFNATNTTGGGISLTNTTGTLAVTGISQTAGGAVSITNAGSLTTSGAISTGAANLTLDVTTDINVQSSITTTSGNVTLKADNDVIANSSGTIATSSGAVAITADDDTSGTGTITYAATVNHGSAGSTWSLGSSTGTATAIISGSGSLTKTGAGTLALSAGNTYGGNTIISAGTLKLGAANVIPDGAGKGNVSLTGTLDLAGNSETINGLTGGGTVDNSTGVGPFTLTVGANDQSSTFSGSITDTTGTVALIKTGIGTLTLSGANTYTGTTTISDGTLLVNGSITSNVTVTSPGILGGTNGTVTGTVSGTGTVAPGSSPGILNVDGTFGIVSNLNIEINGTTVGTQYDQVNVTGSVNLTGTILNITASPAPVFATTYTIINNDLADAVTGTFAGLDEGEVFVVGASTYQITYTGGDGNDVVLTTINPAVPIYNGTPAADTFVITYSGGNVVTTLNGNQIDSRSVASITGQLTVNGLGGGDTLRINFGASVNGTNSPIPVNGLTFDGGTGGPDTLETIGGTFTNGTAHATGAGAGTLSYTGVGLITYSNLTPVIDDTTVTNYTIDALPTADAIIIENSAGSRTIVRENANLFESVAFKNKTNVTVNALAGANDSVTLADNSAPATGLTSLTVNGGGDAGDTITINNAFTLPSGTLTLTAPSISVANGAAVSLTTLNLNGAVSQAAVSTVVVSGTTTIASGAGDATLNQPGNDFGTVVVTSGANVTLRDTNAINLGNINITGNLGVTAAGLVDFIGAGASTVGGTAGITTTTGGINDSGSGSLAVSGLTTLNATGAGNNITLNNASNNFSTVTITNGTNVVLNDTNGIILGTSTATGTFDVTAGGTITQTGVISATTLTTSSVGGTNLSTSTNTVTGFNATNTISGAISLVNSTTTLTVTGISQLGTAAGSNVSVSNTGNLTTSTAAISTTAAADGNIALQATTGVLTIGASGVSAGGAGTVGLTSTGAGNDVLVQGTVSSGSGQITVNSAGAITESGAGKFGTTGLLSTTSVAGQTLNGANTVGSFNATNSTSGNIQLTNTAATLIVTGISQTGGGITVSNTGNLNATGAITDNTAGQAISLTATSGNLTIGGGVTGNTTDTISLNTLTSGNILVNSPVSTGSGTIDITSIGNVNLTAGVSTTGAITITGVDVNSTAGGTISTDTLVTVTNTGVASTLTGVISGAGGLTKLGTGTVVLPVANTYAGQTNVNNGTLAVTTNTALGTTAGNTVVAPAGTLDVRNTNYATLEALSLNGGTLQTSTGTSIWTGTVDLAASSTVDVAGGAQLTISGVISGAGANNLAKIGGGVLFLTNTNTYGGVTNVNFGTLFVTGTNSGTGAVNVNNSATLGGTGTITGNVNVLATSHLAPGVNGPGRLTIVNSLTFATTAFFDVDLNGLLPGTEYDQVRVTLGAVDLGGADGATMTPALNFGAVPYDRFTIIDKQSAGAVTPYFEAHPEGSIYNVGARLRVSYIEFHNPGSSPSTPIFYGDGNDVSLTVMTPPILVTQDVQGNLTLDGTGWNDDITLSFTGTNQLTLIGNDVTNFTGPLTTNVQLAGPYTVTGNITIKLGNGKDKVLIRGVGPGAAVYDSGNLTIDLGSDDDAVTTIDNALVPIISSGLRMTGSLSILGGAGLDNVTLGSLSATDTLTALNVSVDTGTGAGNQTISLDRLTANGNVTLANGGAGAQTVAIGGTAVGVPNSILGNLIINQLASASSFTVGVHNTSVGGFVAITNGNGSGAAAVTIDTTVAPLQTIFGSTTITNGNNLSNAVTLAGFAGGLRLRGNVTVKNGAGTNFNNITVTDIVNSGTTASSFTNGSSLANTITFNGVAGTTFNSFLGLVSATNGTSTGTNVINATRLSSAKGINLTNGNATTSNTVAVGGAAALDTVAVTGNLVIANGTAGTTTIGIDRLTTLGPVNFGNVTITDAATGVGGTGITFGAIAANSISGNVQITNETSTGTRAVTMNRTTVSGRSGVNIYELGAGDTSLTVGNNQPVTIARGLTVQDGSGASTVTLLDLTVGSLTYTDLGGGTDTLNLADTAGVLRVNGVTRIDTAGGSDIVRIATTGTAILNDTVFIALGSGNDLLFIGTHADSPAFNSASKFMFDGGTGTDTFNASPLSIAEYTGDPLGKKAKSKIKNFEILQINP